MSDVPQTNDWVIIHHNGSAQCTDRLRIKDGWLYRTRMWDKADGTALALTFVPDAKVVIAEKVAS